jgi:CBS domain-containing protein
LEPEAIDAPQPEPTQQPLQEQPTSAADQPAPAPQPESPLPETQPQRVDQLRREQPEIAAQPETSEAAPAQECGVNPHESAAEPPNSEPETGPVSDAIKRMTASESEQSAPPPHPCPEQGPALPLSTPAAEIMRTDLAWADAEDTVEAVLAKMQEHNVSHVIVGQKLAPQGIVSRSDIAGAVSPYLRPTFAKWRRPLDDATLRIKVKWIMSTPLTTIASDTPLSAIMEQMQQLHKRALPVVGAQGAIVGMITAYDIFAALLKPAPAQ